MKNYTMSNNIYLNTNEKDLFFGNYFIKNNCLMLMNKIYKNIFIAIFSILALTCGSTGYAKDHLRLAAVNYFSVYSDASIIKYRAITDDFYIIFYMSEEYCNAYRDAVSKKHETGKDDVSSKLFFILKDSKGREQYRKPLQGISISTKRIEQDSAEEGKTDNYYQCSFIISLPKKNNYANYQVSFALDGNGEEEVLVDGIMPKLNVSLALDNNKPGIFILKNSSSKPIGIKHIDFDGNEVSLKNQNNNMIGPLASFEIKIPKKALTKNNSSSQAVKIEYENDDNTNSIIMYMLSRPDNTGIKFGSYLESMFIAGITGFGLASIFDQKQQQDQIMKEEAAIQTEEYADSNKEDIEKVKEGINKLANMGEELYTAADILLQAIRKACPRFASDAQVLFSIVENMVQMLNSIKVMAGQDKVSYDIKGLFKLCEDLYSQACKAKEALHKLSTMPCQDPYNCFTFAGESMDMGMSPMTFAAMDSSYNAGGNKNQQILIRSQSVGAKYKNNYQDRQIQDLTQVIIDKDKEIALLKESMVGLTRSAVNQVEKDKSRPNSKKDKQISIQNEQKAEMIIKFLKENRDMLTEKIKQNEREIQKLNIQHSEDEKSIKDLQEQVAKLKGALELASDIKKADVAQLQNQQLFGDPLFFVDGTTDVDDAPTKNVYNTDEDTSSQHVGGSNKEES